MLTAHDLIELQKVEPDLANLFREVAKTYSIGIAQGLRTLADEEAAIKAGKSWLKNPKNGKHLADSNGLSRAIDFFVKKSDGTADWDVAKYPVVVSEFKRVAKVRGLTIICGADWKVRDYGHIELA